MSKFSHFVIITDDRPIAVIRDAGSPASQSSSIKRALEVETDMKVLSLNIRGNSLSIEFENNIIQKYEIYPIQEY